MTAKCTLTVREVLREEIQPVAKFVLDMMRQVYNHEVSPAAHSRILNMEKFYIIPEDCIFLAAFDKDNEIAGTIGICRYDGRIAALKGFYDTKTTAEMEKCYVAKIHRRKGVGSMLVKEAQIFCQSRGYEVIYLHTHRYLPGALDFWLAQNFTIRLDEKNGQQTVHMDKYIRS